MYEVLTDILFIVLFALIPLTALTLLPFAKISLRRFSIPSLFIIFYMAFAYVGIFPFYFGLDAYAVSLGIVNREIIYMMFIYSSVALIMIICGFIYAHRVFGINPNFIKQRVLVSSNLIQRMFIFCLFLICGLVLLSYIRKIGTIALFQALHGDVAGALVARSNMGNAFEGKYWRYHIFFRNLLDYCVIFFFADYLINRRRLSILIFTASFFVAAFSATMAIEKTPLVNLMIMLYLTYVIYRGGNYWQSAGKYVLVMIISILSFFYIFFMNAPNLILAFQYVLRRIFTGQITPAYFYLNLFPHHIDYLWGTSFPNPGGLMPFQPFPLTVEVAKVIFPNDVAKGIVGSAPTVFWAEMYANFGPIGIIISSFLVGIGLFIVSHILSKFSLSSPIIAATVSLAMHYKTLTGTGLSGYFFDIDFFLISAITFIALLLRGKILIRRKVQFTKAKEGLLHPK